jgi:hypothetical protein
MCNSSNLKPSFKCWIVNKAIIRGLGLWCLTPLSTIFQLYHGNNSYLWTKIKLPSVPMQVTEYFSKQTFYKMKRFFKNPWRNKFVLKRRWRITPNTNCRIERNVRYVKYELHKLIPSRIFKESFHLVKRLFTEVFCHLHRYRWQFYFGSKVAIVTMI